MKINKQFFKTIPVLVLMILAVSCSDQEAAKKSKLKFEISFAEKLSAEALDGRMLLMISDNDNSEPRFQVSDGNSTAQIFGVDVNGLQPGEKAVIESDVFGYPIESLSELPSGEYNIQALFHLYETFNRSDGYIVKLPMDRGEGQKWSRAPGNLYSTPVKILIDPSKNKKIEIVLDNKIPPIEDAPETKYIKHVKIKSELLTEFWGRPMYLGAHILLPEGFDEHPEARYPLVINHGHYPHDFSGFREIPPDPDLEANYSSRFDLDGYNRIQQEYAHQFYKEWTGPDFPRMLIIEIQHANPYYDDSYAVNSENLGPYGDAITYELIPYIEKKFRGIGEGWARFLYGGSTGGWEALAVQVFYPEEYNGCYAACPDPIDFRAYTVVNLYEEKNAYYTEGKFKKTLRPGQRNYLGHISTTLRSTNYRELAIGTNSRSGDQWDIWEAVYSPVGENGYPKRIWDKKTGVIDHDVAEYWKENYDIGYILQRDWKTLGPKLEGKLHIYCGDMDNYYLNNAVYLVEEFLESTKFPYYNGEIDYGDRAEHCWNGDQTRTNAFSRLRYHQMFAPKIVERILKSAPEGADVTSWRY